ncbi:hypothetical protein BJ508DRAFT_308532 [Ascobolus immersus RN42]|uniref:Uncharacterized protein n=1 Tax=Ascobolus immersus RN42 TaxID=1160509 RepID=A0A3N4I1F2_ASCIM|nr:hypothetical protein BJ508DRAFT_308532 [Ascobolus immersus RN42]
MTCFRDLVGTDFCMDVMNTRKRVTALQTRLKWGPPGPSTSGNYLGNRDLAVVAGPKSGLEKAAVEVWNLSNEASACILRRNEYFQNMCRSSCVCIYCKFCALLSHPGWYIREASCTASSQEDIKLYPVRLPSTCIYTYLLFTVSFRDTDSSWKVGLWQRPSWNYGHADFSHFKAEVMKRWYPVAYLSDFIGPGKESRSSRMEQHAHAKPAVANSGSLQLLLSHPKGS